MRTRILYNQDGSGGGNAAPSPAPASTPAAAPAASAAGSGGGQHDAVQSFASQLQALARPKAAEPAQPASDGNKTGGQAGPTEGANGGNDGGQGTTANGEGLTPPEGKGAANGWSPDDLTYLTAQGLGNLAYNEETGKLVKSARELRSKFDEVSGSNANAITQSEEMTRAVHALAAGDVDTFQKVFGVDLQLDRRTPEKRLEEITQSGTKIQQTLQGLLDAALAKGDNQGAGAIEQAWNAIRADLDGQAAVIQREKDKQSLKTELLKEVGKVPDKDSAYKALSQKANTHLATLTQEDKEAPKWFALLEKETKPGGALAALGLNLARLYGTSIQTARFANAVGKALAIQSQMPQILAAEYKRAENDFARKAAQGGLGGSTTGGSAQGGAPTNPVIANLQTMMSSVGR